MALALECGILIGGMDQSDGDEMAARFVADPKGILIVTQAWQYRFKADVEACVIFTEDSFCNYGAAWRCVKPPSVDAPTADDFLAWYQAKKAADMQKARTLSATVLIEHQNYCPEPVREGDEYKCFKCKRRWDAHEDKPPCDQI